MTFQQLSSGGGFHPITASVLPDEFKEEQTVSSIRRNKIRRSRSRNHSSDEEGSVRNSRRFRQSQLDPSHTYIKQIPLQQCGEVTQSLRTRSPKLTERRVAQPTVTQSAVGIGVKKEPQSFGTSSQQQHYRRPLTPHKTQRQVQSGSTTGKPNNGSRSREESLLHNELNQKDFELAELQAELERLKIDRDNLKQVGLRSEKERMKLLNDKNRMESRNTILEQELEQKSKKLYQLENTMLENENNLAEAKSSLEKLRKIIKENRMAELENENRRFEAEAIELRRTNVQLRVDLQTVQRQLVSNQQELEEARHKLNRLEAQIVTKEKSYHIESMKEQYLNRELALMRSRLEEGRTRHQIQLQQVVNDLRDKLLETESHTKSLEIRMSCLARRQLQAQQQLKKQGSAEYLQLKERFRKFLQEYQKFRKEHNQLKVSYALLNRKRNSESVSIEPSELSFELSPQK